MLFTKKHSPGLSRRMFAYCAGLTLALVQVSAFSASLLDALKLAEASDPVYQEAQATALAVAEGIPQAQALLWLPHLDLTSGISYNSQRISTGSGFSNTGDTGFRNYDYSLNIVQPVYHADRKIRLEQANKRLQQAQTQLDAAHQALMLRVAERYFDVLAALDDLSFARAEKASLASQLNEAKTRFDVGVIAITDVEEAQAGYDRALAEEISAINTLENTREALREVTGSYPQSLMLLGADLHLARPVPDSIENWTDTALAQNLDIGVAQIATEIAMEEIGAQSAEGNYPTLDITGSEGKSALGGRLGDVTEGGQIGLRLNVPLYAGGSVLSKTRQARHEHSAAIDRLEQARRAVYRATREAFLGIVSRISSVKALGQAVVSSQTALDATVAGSEIGTRTMVDVVVSERALSQARRDYAHARYDYILDRLRLKKAAGTLAPADMAAANKLLSAAPAEKAKASQNTLRR